MHLAGEDAHRVLLTDCLLDCGIKVKVAELTDASWVADAYQQRHRDPVSVLRPMCHTTWGEKIRPIGYPLQMADESTLLFLVHDACPFTKCENHTEMVGFGTCTGMALRRGTEIRARWLLNVGS